MNNIKYALIVSLAVPALSMATGCSSSSSDSGSTNTATDTTTYLTIDDFETSTGTTAGGATLTTSLSAPFNGGWFSYSDVGAMLEEIPTLTVAASDSHDGAKGKSTNALHVTRPVLPGASGIGTEIYADPTTQKHNAYDASKATGIVFWAKGVAGTSLILRAATIDSYPTPGDATPRCDLSAPAGSDQRCYDDFSSKPIDIGTTWDRHVVKFSAMDTGHWGKNPPDNKMATNAIYAVKLASPGAAAVDVWVDDVALYCENGATGCVPPATK